MTGCLLTKVRDGTVLAFWIPGKVQYIDYFLHVAKKDFEMQSEGNREMKSGGKPTLHMVYISENGSKSGGKCMKIRELDVISRVPSPPGREFTLHPVGGYVPV
jgi:hypothetical protein